MLEEQSTPPVHPEGSEKGAGNPEVIDNTQRRCWSKLREQFQDAKPYFAHCEKMSDELDFPTEQDLRASFGSSLPFPPFFWSLLPSHGQIRAGEQDRE